MFVLFLGTLSLPDPKSNRKQAQRERVFVRAQAVMVTMKEKDQATLTVLQSPS